MTLEEYRITANVCASRSWSEQQADCFWEIAELCIQFPSVETVKAELATRLASETITPAQRKVYQEMYNRERPAACCTGEKLYVRGNHLVV